MRNSVVGPTSELEVCYFPRIKCLHQSSDDSKCFAAQSMKGIQQAVCKLMFICTMQQISPKTGGQSV